MTQNAQNIREVRKIFRSQPTIEGAGVRLQRGFSYPEARELDPFLLFDDFSSPDPVDFMAGFPWHPHRGIETVTYILEGEVAHEDSLGNAGTITNGDVQWMSAGSGIIHQEMPQVFVPGTNVQGIKGFQLWVNLPKTQKMAKPRYQDMSSSNIPVIEQDGARAKVITGAFGSESGPVTEVAGAPTYLDVAIEPKRSFEFPTRAGDTVLIYIIEGTALVGSMRTPVGKSIIALMELGDLVHVEAPDMGANGVGTRFLLMEGTPLHEPVAWHGPIVMNTNEELVEAFKELNEGTFIRGS
ncbi:MAG: pirin family protein [Candidatus Pacebacteria bacterium]|nr:pirin family protein [Candidatus Paceibacterota bacterium]